MPLMRNLNPGNQFAVKIDWVSASYKHLYCHRDHIDSTNMLFLWNNCTIDVHSLGGIVIMLIIYIYIYICGFEAMGNPKSQ